MNFWWARTAASRRSLLQSGRLKSGVRVDDWLMGESRDQLATVMPYSDQRIHILVPSKVITI
jgi:hypothetical protein